MPFFWLRLQLSLKFIKGPLLTYTVSLSIEYPLLWSLATRLSLVLWVSFVTNLTGIPTNRNETFSEQRPKSTLPASLSLWTASTDPSMARFVSVTELLSNKTPVMSRRTTFEKQIKLNWFKRWFKMFHLPWFPCHWMSCRKLCLWYYCTKESRNECSKNSHKIKLDLNFQIKQLYLSLA